MEVIAQYSLVVSFFSLGIQCVILFALLNKRGRKS